MTLIFGITTYKRLDYLQTLINSFVQFTDFTQNKWILIIHNDCLNDETTNYINNLRIKGVLIIPIESNRSGVHIGTNKILQIAEKFTFDYGFKADDDVFLIKKGWENAYIEAIKLYNYEHLSYFNANWSKNLSKNSYLGLKYYGSVWRSQGAMWTFTPKILKTVGYFDVKNMGFRGIGHINYSFRCCKAGFNEENTFFDIDNSESYIQMHENYKASLSNNEILEHRKNQARKIELTKQSEIYISFE